MTLDFLPSYSVNMSKYLKNQRKANLFSAKLVVILIFIILYQTDSVYAHDVRSLSGLQAGILHPLTGLDHLLAMISVGTISSVLGGSAIWKVPTAFLVAMLGGAVLGYYSGEFVNVELGVSSSVFILGIALTIKNFTPWSGWIFLSVIVFGVCHGLAHGIELPLSASPIQFSYGFLISSLFLHVCGLLIAEALSKTKNQVFARRILGAFITMIGAWFLIDVL